MNKSETEQKKINKEIDKFHRSGNIQKAIETCQCALINDANNPELHIKLGDLYIEWHLDIHQARQYVDEAITEYHLAMEAGADSAEIYYKLGLAFYYKRDLDKSINYFEIALEHDSKFSEAYYMIAEISMKRGKFLEASEFAHKAIETGRINIARAYYLLYLIQKISTNKNVFKAYIYFLKYLVQLPFDKDAKKEAFKRLSYIQFAPLLFKSSMLIYNNKLDDALALYQNALEKAPGFVDLYIVTGEIYRQKKRYEDAICEFKMAIWLDSLNVKAYAKLCDLYEEIQDFDSAIEVCRNLISIQPHVAHFQNNLATYFYMKGEIPKAISHYQNSITLRPNAKCSSDVARTLGFIYQEHTKDLDASIASYQIAYNLSPDDLDIYLNLGNVFYEKNEYDNALTVYRKALEKTPYSSRLHCNLGYLYWGKGNIDEAIKEYEKAIRFDPNYDIAYNNLGVIYLDDLGRVQKAIELFEEAARCNPNYALAHYNLARAVAITGNKIEAAKLYQIALDLNSYSHELDRSEIEDKIQGLFD
ncbi:tetratricopeptide repeat protein [bacterium]|nr:tetratricopeptide repeat protein [bacterium]